MHKHTFIQIYTHTWSCCWWCRRFPFYRIHTAPMQFAFALSFFFYYNNVFFSTDSCSCVCMLFFHSFAKISRARTHAYTKIRENEKFILQYLFLNLNKYDDIFVWNVAAMQIFIGQQIKKMADKHKNATKLIHSCFFSSQWW